MKRPTPHITFFADKYIGKPYSYIKAFSTELINEIVNNEDGVKMPLGLGVLQVIGKNSRSFDYKNSIKYDKKIHHNNSETDGWKFTVSLHRVFIDKKAKYKSKCKTFSFNFVKFKPFDLLKLKLRDKIKEGKWIYYYKKYIK